VSLFRELAGQGAAVLLASHGETVERQAAGGARYALRAIVVYDELDEEYERENGMAVRARAKISVDPAAAPGLAAGDRFWLHGSERIEYRIDRIKGRSGALHQATAVLIDQRFVARKGKLLGT
jgi:hypothetical protein